MSEREYPALSPGQIGVIEEKLTDLRKNGTHLTRLCYFDKEMGDFGGLEDAKQSGGYHKSGVQYGTYCMGPHHYDREIGDPRFVFAIPFSGQSPANTGGPTGHLKGGDVSKRWLEFLMSDTGPFRNVAAHVVNRDNLDKINEDTGFIFEDTSKIGAGQLYGFCIAVRFAQECYDRALKWMKFCDLGIDPAVAYILSVYWAWKEDGDVLKVHQKRQAGHTVLYYQPVLIAKNFVLGNYPGDKLAGKTRHFIYFEGEALAYTDHPLYKLMYKSWDAENQAKLFCGVEPGMTALEVSERIMKEVLREDESA